ncbi:hypothetical protein [Fimbriiglobus ruber]|uniref:Lipid/polyisoprenoid-binding YceI-like domain-containing protein n=1 Tax=Fimbriiglobus ruber TaxID=1908690 RepID=A0A225DSE8_9BACT|nr:hypothetical protein [Fimbriiglobus ruber]OWK43993.1 hypothetical protein FRUB_03592 [Fimbriiglobus ruber]
MITRLLSALSLFSLIVVPAAAQEKAAANNFKISLVANIEMKSTTINIAIDATTDFAYSWQQEAKTRTLMVGDMTVVAKTKDVTVMDLKMGRAGMFGTMQGKELNIKFEDAPDELKTLLKDSFDAPLCKNEVDENGVVTSEKIVAGPGSKTLVETGMIANSSFFHPPFFAAKNEWQSVNGVGVGKGVASGKLKYTKIAGAKEGFQTVSVAGTLNADGLKLENGGTVKKGNYKITGTQTYDLKRKEWVDGKVKIDLEFDYELNKVVGAGKGKMTLDFSVVDKK